MKNKLLGLFAVIGILLGVLFFTKPVEAASEKSGDWTYTVQTDGTVRLTKYSGSATTVSVPALINGKKVTSIAKSTFSSNKKVTNITVSQYVSQIDALSFTSCSALTKLAVNSNNTSYCAVGNVIYTKDKKTAIVAAGGITSVTIDANTTRIGPYAFCDCGKLTTVKFPSSSKLNSIAAAGFAHCVNLTSFTMPDTVTAIGAKAFYDCTNMSTMVLSSKLKSIPREAFSWCTKLSAITFPNKLTAIGSKAFLYCFALKNIDTNRVATIDSYAFFCCGNLKNVAIRAYAKTIADGAFFFCDKITKIRIEGDGITLKKDVFKWCDSLAVYCKSSNSSVTSYCKSNKVKYYHYDIKKSKFTSKKNETNGIYVTWSKATGVDGYILYRTNQYGQTARVKTLSKDATSYVDTGAIAGRTYIYTLKPYFKVCGELILHPDVFTKEIIRVGNVSLAEVSRNSTDVTIMWNKISYADGYKIYRSTSDGNYVQIATVKSTKPTSYVDKGLVKGKKYYYYIVAYKGSWRGAETKFTA